MEYELLQVSRDGHVATVTLDRPKKLNALSAALMREIEHVANSFREDAELCFRLRERGWEVVYEPLARASHRRHNLPRRRRSMPSHVNYHSLKNRFLLRAYHETWASFPLTFLPSLFRDLGAIAYVLARERSSLPVFGWLWRNRDHIVRRRRRIQSRRTVSRRQLAGWFLCSGRPL